LTAPALFRRLSMSAPRRDWMRGGHSPGAAHRQTLPLSSAAPNPLFEVSCSDSAKVEKDIDGACANPFRPFDPPIHLEAVNKMIRNLRCLHYTRFSQFTPLGQAPSVATAECAEYAEKNPSPALSSACSAYSAVGLRDPYQVCQV
jgi:hypothetical protein